MVRIVQRTNATHGRRSHQSSTEKLMGDITLQPSRPRAKPTIGLRARLADAAVWCAVPTGAFVLFIVVPLMALVWRAVTEPAFWPSLTKPVVLEALWVTCVTTTATLLVAVTAGTPLAYLLA